MDASAPAGGMKPIRVGERGIGPGHPCFVIAEAGVNHNGDARMARALIAAAHDARADAVKFQTWITNLVVTRQAPLAEYQATSGEPPTSQFEMLRSLELSQETFRDLKAYADEVGILFLSTPDDPVSADFLECLGVPAFKIGSGELTNPALLAHVARKGRPVILSTGMATLDEVRLAVQTVEAENNRQIVLLHCVSAYPADPADCNLRAMDVLAREFGYPIGFSDHTLSSEVPWAAVARGACVVEKHFTLDRALQGPDHRASSTPEELAALVDGIRRVEAALGDGVKRPAQAELEVRLVVRRTIVAARDLRAGHVLQRSDLAVLRAGPGLPPSDVDQVVGRTVTRPLPQGAVIAWEDLR